MKPFERSYLTEAQFQRQEEQFRRAGIAEESIAQQMAVQRSQIIWRNNEYQVNVTPLPARADRPAMVHLSIKAVKKGVVRDWRVFQTIKNMLVGRECEAVELYPAESRLVDSANQYHLFAFVDPELRFPIGYGERLVDGSSTDGAKQRPFEEGA